MNGYTTPQEYIAQAEACLATAKEELAKARAAQARARVWIALIENALVQDKLTQDMNAAEIWFEQCAQCGKQYDQWQGGGKHCDTGVEECDPHGA